MWAKWSFNYQGLVENKAYIFMRIKRVTVHTNERQLWLWVMPTLPTNPLSLC